MFMQQRPARSSDGVFRLRLEMALFDMVKIQVRI